MYVYMYNSVNIYVILELQWVEWKHNKPFLSYCKDLSVLNSLKSKGSLSSFIWESKCDSAAVSKPEWDLELVHQSHHINSFIFAFVQQMKDVSVPASLLGAGIAVMNRADQLSPQEVRVGENRND